MAQVKIFENLENYLRFTQEVFLYNNEVDIDYN